MAPVAAVGIAAASGGAAGGDGSGDGVECMRSMYHYTIPTCWNARVEDDDGSGTYVQRESEAEPIVDYARQTLKKARPVAALVSNKTEASGYGARRV